MKQSLTIEFKIWNDGLVAFRCYNANLIGRLSFNPFDDCLHSTYDPIEKIIAEIQTQFGDSKPAVNGDVFHWERTLNECK